MNSPASCPACHYPDKSARAWWVWQAAMCECGLSRGLHAYAHPHRSIYIGSECLGFTLTFSDELAISDLEAIVRELE